MYRHAREARLYDGPDEVHIQSTARRILKHMSEANREARGAVPPRGEQAMA
jgi:hypothetical protein